MYDHHICPTDFRYGPLFAVALTPLAVLPTWLGGILWNWLNLGLFFWSVCALARRVFPCHWTLSREAAFLFLVLMGSGRTIWSAQSNPLIFAAVAAAAIAILDQRWWLAAVLLAAPVHIKVWPLAAALLLIACWPRQLGWRFTVALVVLAAVPLLVKPPAVVWARYCDWYTAMMGPMLKIRHQYRDAWTIWHDLVNPSIDLHAYLLVQLATAAGALILCLWQKRRLRSTAKLLTFVLGMWTAWQLAFGPGTERNTFGVIAPLTAWATVVALAEHRGRVVMLTAIFFMDVLAIGHVERTLEPFFLAARAVHPLGVLLFAGWLIYYACHWEPGEAESPQNEGKPPTPLACVGPGG
jgi:hypothetical protein